MYLLQLPKDSLKRTDLAFPPFWKVGLEKKCRREFNSWLWPCWACPAFGGAALWILIQSLGGRSSRSWFPHLYSCSEARSKSVLLNSHHVSSQATVCPLDGLIYLLIASLSNSFSAWAAIQYSSSCHRSSCPNSFLALLDTRQWMQGAVLMPDASSPI